MIELIAPTFLNNGFAILRDIIDRKIEAADLKAAQEERLKVVLFWMKEEISYNLDILSVWDGPDHTFDLDPPQVRRLCGHLRTEICSLIAADIQISAGLKSALDKVNFATENPGFNGESDPKKLTGLAALLFILRKIEVLKRVAEACDSPDADVPSRLNYSVRLQNIKKAHLDLYNALSKEIGK